MQPVMVAEGCDNHHEMNTRLVSCFFALGNGLASASLGQQLTSALLGSVIHAVIHSCSLLKEANVKGPLDHDDCTEWVSSKWLEVVATAAGRLRGLSPNEKSTEGRWPLA